MTATLTARFGERARHGGRFVADALVDLCESGRIEHSVLVRGIEGFGRKHQLRTDSSLSLSEDLPAVLLATDERERIEAVAAAARELVPRGLVTVTAADGDGPDALLTVWLGRRQRAAGVPAHVTALRMLRAAGASGATALLGVDGTIGAQRRRARWFDANSEVPTLVFAVGHRDVLAAAGTQLSDALDTATSLTPVTLDVHRPAGSHHQLTVYTSEARLHGGLPIHRALVRRLRAAGALGATTVRGIQGFHGEHGPDGDRLWSPVRRAPVVTSVVDTAERVAEWRAIAAQLTRDHGLVTVTPVDVVA